jgi:hypothetical protein
MDELRISHAKEAANRASTIAIAEKIRLLDDDPENYGFL